MSPSLYNLARKCLFQINPESAHTLTLHGLRIAEKMRLLKPIMGTPLEDPIELFGLRFPNRVGLAAGMDKDADTVDAFGRLGFGFIEVGTLTPRPQSGNEKPRLFRLIPHKGIINRMGFNNHGIDKAIHSLSKRHTYKGIVGVNIGKNKVTPNESAAHDYVTCMNEAWMVADYIAINFSSPNTPGLRELQNADAAARLLAVLKAEQNNLTIETGKHVPLLMKVAPDLNDEQIRDLSRVFLDGGLDGLIATNTTLSRDGVEEHPAHQETGGLSGQPLTDKSTEIIAAFASELQGKIPIMGVGGIMSGQDAVDKLKAGASLIQLYSGFIYKGPPLITECINAMKGH